MVQYIPNTDKQREEMLQDIGYSSIEELFVNIPNDVKINEELKLPRPMSEMELATHMEIQAGKNRSLKDHICFLGAGSYDHYVPSVINSILSRQEFYTAYTPYQPEISQGTLQAIFEYQTMICELTAMDVANASMYDGATALAEAALMACDATRRTEILVAKTVHPEYRKVLHTYGRFNETQIVEIGYSGGLVDLEDLETKLSADTAAIIIQSPNFLGNIENVREAAELAHKHKALVIISADPISLAVLKAPGELGADIVVGEGQSLGTPMGFGGPYLGFFATTEKLMRRMPGRIVGMTTDHSGNRGFVLTIQTREQHIRRERATSNICTNQALNALAATIYMTVLGKQGLKEVAALCMQKAHYAQQQLIGIGKCLPIFSAPFFKEFAVKLPSSVDEVNKILLKQKIIGGYSLEKDYPELKNGWLIAVTEKRSKNEIDILAEAVRGVKDEE